MTCKIKPEPEVCLADQRKQEGQISWLASTYFDRALLACARYDMSCDQIEAASRDYPQLLYRLHGAQRLVKLSIIPKHNPRAYEACFGFLRVLERLPAASGIRLVLGPDSQVNDFSESGVVFELIDVSERRKFGMLHVAGKKQTIITEAGHE